MASYKKIQALTWETKDTFQTHSVELHESVNNHPQQLGILNTAQDRAEWSFSLYTGAAICEANRTTEKSQKDKSHAPILFTIIMRYCSLSILP